MESTLAVALGSYARVLAVLQLDPDLERLALDDALGRRLQDLGIPERKRAPRRSGAAQTQDPKDRARKLGIAAGDIELTASAFSAIDDSGRR